MDGLGVAIPLSGALIVGLGIAALWDLRTMRIPRFVPNGLVGLWLIAQCGALVAGGRDGLLPWAISAGRLVVGAAMIVGVLSLARRLLARRSPTTPFGIGDVKLLAVVGLYLGVERALEVMLVACIVALALAWLLPRTGWHAPDGREPDVRAVERPATLHVVPFAPAIALGAVVVMAL